MRLLLRLTQMRLNRLMHNKWHALQQQLNHKVQQAKSIYQGFRLYDFGSYTLNRLTPKDGYDVQHNIAYGLKARQRLDLFQSHNPRPERPLIVFVHGGAWSHGDKKDYRFIGEAFAREGFDVAVINYHLAPEHIFPSSIDDLNIALSYLIAAQDKLKIRTEKLLLMGHSAGAFNVMSAVYHPQPEKRISHQHIHAIIGLAGPYHFDYKGDPICAHAFDQDMPYQQVMPYYFVEKNQIKHYLMIAEKDQIVGHSNSVDLDKKLQQYGNHSQLVKIPRVGHITMIGSVSSLFSRFYRTKDHILQALDEALDDTPRPSR